jgi:SsrA-binding protein
MGKKPEKKKSSTDFVVCSNGKTVARYHIDERFEAGMVLSGSEVKSLRAKRGDLDGAYARIERGELWLHKMYIAPYAQATAYGHEPRRSRKLLMHRHELEKLTGKLALRGYTLVPIQVYFKSGRAKVELGLAKSKDIGDKREDIKRKLDVREAKAAMARGRERR